MNLILVGIEYSGTTTLADAITDWFMDETGLNIGPHDHFKLPHFVHEPLTDEEQRLVLALSPQVLEQLQRHQIEYHLQDGFFESGDANTCGFYIEDAVYGPLYWGYGGPGELGDRTLYSRHCEDVILEYEPETVLILLTATPEVIAKRMKESPHSSSPLKEEDIELVLRRFQQEFDTSRIRNKITLDTSMVAVEETLTEFVAEVDPFLTDADRNRMRYHRRLHHGTAEMLR
jgi:hypothetical protein